VYLAAGTMPTSSGSTTPSPRASTSPASDSASDSVSGSVSGSGTPADATGLTAQGTPAESPVPGWIWALGGALVATAVAVLVVLFSRRRAAGGRG